jgi:hypothetical protein
MLQRFFNRFGVRGRRPREMPSEVFPTRATSEAWQIIVRGHDHIDPASLYEFRRLEASKDHREFVTTQGHGSIFTGAKMTNLDQQALQVRLEQYGSSSYRIIPEQPLPPGEYTLAVRGRFSELYCFGVDQ